MRLEALNASFVRATGEGFNRGVGFAEAQGVLFLCPLCYVTNAGVVGTHMVLCWFAGRGAPANAVPAPRWAITGTGIGDLTLNPSVAIIGGCAWHGWVRSGEAS